MCKTRQLFNEILGRTKKIGKYRHFRNSQVFASHFFLVEYFEYFSKKSALLENNTLMSLLSSPTNRQEQLFTKKPVNCFEYYFMNQMATERMR